MAVSTSVLIVGGGLTGLSTALFLAHRGVPCIVVERHPGTSIQYKLRGLSPRSMEIYRAVGVEDDIRLHQTGDQKGGALARARTLADPDITWLPNPWADTTDISPAAAATCDQDVLEPMLQHHAERHGADVRFHTELSELRQDPDGIVARVLDRETQHEETIRASYAVLADGANGTLRQQLGIARHGPGVLQHWMNVIFETDLEPVLRGRALTSIFLTEMNGTFVPRAGGRWLMAVPYVPERGQRAEDFTDAYCQELIRQGAGRPDVRADIVDAREWELAAYVADRFAAGRVFLVGDTAHVIPPTGGFGGNTGVHDAHNLAWKLAMVIRDEAGPGLLDTYDSERRPVAEATLAQALARLQAWFRDPSKSLPPAVPMVDDAWVIFGHRYPTGAFIPEESGPVEPFEDPRAPSGCPGSRAGNLVVEHRGVRANSIDVFAGRWVLCVGPQAESWAAAAGHLARTGPLVVDWYRVGERGELRDIEHRWSAVYGVSGAGAVLIRPDGFIAWRARGADQEPEGAL